jgi:hypothetical protein
LVIGRLSHPDSDIDRVPGTASLPVRSPHLRHIGVVQRGRTGVDTVAELMLVLAVLIIGYVVSLKLNPYERCSNCKNSPKIKGWVFTKAHHVCPKCGGTGQQLRFGRRRLFGAPENPGER